MNQKKKKYKVVESEEFKEQKENLPEDIKEELDKAILAISENPFDVPNSMSLFGDPSPKELKQWVSNVEEHDIDLVLEYLNDKGCLNKLGKKLYKDFSKGV
jgi:hypothetical protein